MPITWPNPQHHSGEAFSPATTTSSLPSYLSDDDFSSLDSFDSQDQALLIQEEWDESMRQLESVVSLLLLPFFGKWYGRKFAYWAFGRYQTYGGFTRAFFGLASAASS